MKCPICDKPTQWQDNPHRPFCSQRCQLLDFGNWVDEEYRVPSDEAQVFSTRTPDESERQTDSAHTPTRDER